MLTSIEGLDLDSKGKNFWNTCRNPQEEIIYFLLIDRFSTGKEKTVIFGQDISTGFGTAEELKGNLGGNLKGIESKLPYLKNLGISALWLSPVFENNPESYHGYAIQNYLAVDPRFGTKDDLVSLIAEAHKLGIKVFLDIIINHTGNNWSYKEDKEYTYNKGKKYAFGQWRFPDKPFPLELRDEQLYRKQGMIRNWDIWPETEQGDFFSLKKILLDESPEGKKAQVLLQKIYCWWIKETDCDGFRLDTVKHAGMLPVKKFCTAIKEYCLKIGKKDFFIFGELPLDDIASSSYVTAEIWGNKKSWKVYSGPDTLLDFSLHFTLPKVIKGVLSVAKLHERFKKLDRVSTSRPEAAKSLITFLDNHDQIESSFKARFATGAEQKQIMGGIGILFALPGIPCLYYGTEQGFSGKGFSDALIREAMFSASESISAHNPECCIYRFVQVMAAIRTSEPALIYGTLHFNAISFSGKKYFTSSSINHLICFSRLLFDEEITVLYNISKNISRKVYVRLETYVEKNLLKVIVGNHREIKVEKIMHGEEPFAFFSIYLEPMEFVILK